MLKVYGRNTSLNVQKVLWACDEMGLEYQHDEQIGGAYGRNRDPQYLAMNPNGLVPTIDDDGFILWESNSIVRYLTAKHKSPLYPTDPRDRADVERWMDWRLSILGGVAGGVWAPLYLGLVRTPPEKRDAAAIEDALRKCGNAFAMVDARLKDRAYLGGDQLTIGDITIGPFAYRWFGLPVDKPPLPNFERYYERLTKRPAYQRHVMIGLA